MVTFTIIPVCFFNLILGFLLLYIFLIYILYIIALIVGLYPFSITYFFKLYNIHCENSSIYLISSIFILMPKNIRVYTY